MILAPLAFVLGIGASTPAYFQLFGIRFASFSPAWLSLAAVIMFVLCAWQYRVLTRPSIRDLFLRPAVELPANQSA